MQQSQYIYLLKDWLNENGYKTKVRISKRGRKSGGLDFDVSMVHNVLNNPTYITYIGRIKHLDKTYKGRHKAIISQDIWDDVRKIMNANLIDKKLKGKRKPRLLVLLRDLIYYQDELLKYAVSRQNNRANHYYVRKGTYISAQYLEDKVIDTVKDVLKQSIFFYSPEVYNKLKYIDIDSLSKPKLHKFLHIIIKKITLESNYSLKLELHKEIDNINEFISNEMIEFDTKQNPNIYIENNVITLHKAVDLENINNNRRIIGDAKINEPNVEELAAIATAFKYKKLYEELGSVKQVAETLKQGTRRIYKYLNLAYLYPTIINNILDNKLPHITVTQLINIASKTYIWAEQEEMIKTYNNL